MKATYETVSLQYFPKSTKWCKSSCSITYLLKPPLEHQETLWGHYTECAWTQWTIRWWLNWIHSGAFHSGVHSESESRILWNLFWLRDIIRCLKIWKKSHLHIIFYSLCTNKLIKILQCSIKRIYLPTLSNLEKYV